MLIGQFVNGTICCVCPTAEFPRDIHLNTVDPSATDGKQELEAVVLGQLMRVASHLVTMGVQFVGCQKVMHPLLKDFLREKVCNPFQTMNIYRY